MKIGLIADTHNNLAMTMKAVEIFKEKGVELVIHAGDLTSPRIMELFRYFPCVFVLGNSDIDVEMINARAEEMGCGKVKDCCELEIDGKKIFVLHGNDVPAFRKAVSSGKYHYIVKGHTHFFENYVSSNTRIVNPGTLYGDDECTVAILDTKTDKVEKIKIECEA
ncbi:MAG: metallophosphatase family protein [Spirochaetes bacterium]|nr:metallophosphatase family protein [Spirochaetota bacterium]